jgi:hypothetical protein
VTSLGLPDEPRWVEAHGIAADPAGWQRALGAGFALGHDVARLIVIAGDADPSLVAALAREYPTHAILIATAELTAALDSAGRTPQRALIHTLPDPEALPDLEGAIPLPPGASLAHLPRPLADELAAARSRIWTVYVDGEPAAFAHAPWRSARWFDVSVDTVVTARQLGLGTLVAAALIRDERAHGREPVWAADEGNVASLALARRLGFVAIDEIWVAPPVGPPDPGS